ncbi:MAG: hypothetical protein R3C53_12155 [Pirellulaceae bacterium]
MVKIPSRLEDLLHTAAMEKVMEVLHQPDISSSVREALNKVGLKDANPLGQVQNAWRQARGWIESLAEQIGGSARNQATINATGCLFLPEFGGVPMSSAVALGYAKAATTFHGSAAHNAMADQVARSILGQPVVWIASPLATLQLLRIAAISPGGIVIARADAVRVPGLGDVRSMLTSTAQGGGLVELGAANGASEADWSAAVTSSQQIVLLVSPNGLTAESATEQRKLAIAAAEKVGATVIELLADGVVDPALSERLGLPNIKHRLASGVDLVLVPTHCLLAGPSGMLVAGNEKLVAALKTNALAWGAICDGPQLVASAIALEMGGSDKPEAGVVSQLTTNPENLKNRASRIAIQLNDSEKILSAVEVPRTCPLGATPWDRYRLDNWAVRVSPREQKNGAADLHEELLRGCQETQRMSIATTLDRNDLLVDLRFVSPEDDHEIVEAFLGPRGETL